MTDPAHRPEMAPPPNLFATPLPGTDPAVGSTFLPAPGLDGGYHQPRAYSPPAEPARPTALLWAALLLAAPALLCIVPIMFMAILFGDSVAVLPVLSALAAVAAATWLAVRPGDGARLTATLAAAGGPWLMISALDSVPVGSTAGLLLAIPVWMLLWLPKPVSRYFQQLPEFRAAKRAGAAHE